MSAGLFCRWTISLYDDDDDDVAKLMMLFKVLLLPNIVYTVVFFCHCPFFEVDVYLVCDIRN